MALKKTFGRTSKMRPIGPPQVTARDPTTGLKATGVTKMSAKWKLEAKVGGKVSNPRYTRD